MDRYSVKKLPDTFGQLDLLTNKLFSYMRNNVLDDMYLFMRECCNTKEVKTGGVYKDGK